MQLLLIIIFFDYQYIVVLKVLKVFQMSKPLSKKKVKSVPEVVPEAEVLPEVLPEDAVKELEVLPETEAKEEKKESRGRKAKPLALVEELKLIDKAFKAEKSKVQKLLKTLEDEYKTQKKNTNDKYKVGSVVVLKEDRIKQLRQELESLQQ